MDQIVITHLDGTTLSLRSRENASNITSAEQRVEKLGEDVVDITVVSGRKLTFYIGDKIDIFGRDYTLNTPAKEKKTSENFFQYDLHFEGVQYDLIRASFNVNVDTTNSEIQDINGNALTGDLKRFLDVLIANANRVFPGKWTLGDYPEPTETRNETFGDTDNCLAVLQSLCGSDKYNVEFKIDIDNSGGRTLNVGAFGNVFPFTFEFGRGHGMYELTREKISNSNIVTRLYVYGGSQNIMTTRYRASMLCLPGKTKAQSYIEDAAAIAKYGIWEATKIFDDIKPERTGTVTSIGANELEFIDSTMDFDLTAKWANTDADYAEYILLNPGMTRANYNSAVVGNTKYLIADTSVKVHFNTGNLAGYEFEVLKGGYDHATKKFTLLSQTDENGYTFPSPTSAAFQIAVGDEYVLLDISLPKSYEDNAEAKLSTKGNAQLIQDSQPRVQYGMSVDRFFLANIVGSDASTNVVWIGDYIPIKDTDINVDQTIRVKGFRRNLLQDMVYNLTISDLPAQTEVVNRIVASLNGIDKVVRINNLEDPARARRNYLAAQEVLNMVFDPEGDFYTDRIKPLSIDTTMLSVGAKSMQFGMVGTIFEVNYLGAKNRVKYSGGALTHYAIVDEAGDPRTWTIEDGDVTLATDAAYYMYAKCARTGAGATIYFSATKILADSDPTYFHFLIGVVNSVGTNNERALALMYGFTTINGRFIKTGRIQNADGSVYFDLDAGEFRGNFKFTSGTSIEAAVQNAQTTAQAAKDYVDNILPGELEYLQNQIDGQVESWFYPYTPTTSNQPAAQWDAEGTSQQHVGDTFTNTQPYVDDQTTPDAGKSWRWVVNDSVYSWTPIADSDAVKALLAASKAQDTADGKRRNFTAQPVTPYQVGDLWSQGAAGDLMRCKTERLTGSYQAADWEKASKYTDDTLAQEAVGKAEDAQTAAAAAQSDATDAINAIGNIVSDNVLSAAEKPMQRKEWNIIAGEKAGIDTQATTFGITTEKTTYDNAFQALANYLNAGLAWSSGVPSWLADANLASNTTIVGSTYRSTWKAYYDARTALLNAIALKAKTLADAAKSAVDSLVINGRNYIVNSKDEREFSNTLEIPLSMFAANEVISLSFYGKYADAGTESWSFLVKNGGTGTGGTTLLNLNVSEHAYTFKSGTITLPASLDNLRIVCANGGAYAYHGFLKLIKVEKGSRVTEWSPAPEDVDYLTNAMKDGSTDITGGLLATNAIFLKNNDATPKIVGGLSGVAADNVAAWFGGTYAQAIADAAKAFKAAMTTGGLDRKDGAGHRAFGNFAWDVLGNIYVKGILEVLSGGKIGSFDIVSGNIIGYNSSDEEVIRFGIEDLPTDSGLASNWTNFVADFSLDLDGSASNWEGTGTTFSPQSGYASDQYFSIPYATKVKFYIGQYGFNFDDPSAVSSSSASFYLNIWNSSNVSVFAGWYTNGQEITLSAGGTYHARLTIFLSIECYDYYGTSFSFGYVHDAGRDEYQEAVKKTAIGKDGFYSYFSASEFLHFKAGNGFKAKVSAANKWDVPGLLAAGSVASGGSSSNQFGAKVGSSSKTATGTYTVNHSIGHSSYVVLLNPQYYDRHAYVTSKGTTSFTVVVKNGAGTSLDQAFEYAVIGMN